MPLIQDFIYTTGKRPPIHFIESIVVRQLDNVHLKKIYVSKYFLSLCTLHSDSNYLMRVMQQTFNQVTASL